MRALPTMACEGSWLRASWGVGASFLPPWETLASSAQSLSRSVSGRPQAALPLPQGLPSPAVLLLLNLKGLVLTTLGNGFINSQMKASDCFVQE